MATAVSIIHAVVELNLIRGLTQSALNLLLKLSVMKKIIAAIGLLSAPAVVLADGSASLLPHATTNLTLSVINGSAGDFFINEESTDLGGDITQTYVWFKARYGYDDIWEFDFRTGYAEAEFETNPEDESDIADTTFGVSYQFINEFELDNGLPTITGRLAYTIGGDYETDVIEAIGDGANGFDVSLLAGKSITRTVSLFGDLTFRQRNEDVADAIKYLVGAFYSTPIRGLGIQAAVGGIRTDSDINIGDPGFGVEQFPQTDRDQDLLIGGANYGFGNGFSLGATYTILLDGKNVPDTDVISVTAGYSF